MRFTNSPFEKMMQEVPKPRRPIPKRPPPGTRCVGCSFWNGTACVGICYRELVITSSQHGPKLEG